MNTWDLIVVGGGPAGYVAAIRASQLGLATLCVEQRPALGGTCLHEGCIPSKALLESSWRFYQAKHLLKEHGILCGEPNLDLAAMHDRKQRLVAQLAKGIDQLFRKYKVTRLQGVATVTPDLVVQVRQDDGSVSTQQGRRILLATGSAPVPLPHLPVDGQMILDSRHLLTLEACPRHLVVVGAGAIGLELGSVWLRLGSRVTVVEAQPEILPGVDETLIRHGKRLWRQQGFTFLTNTTVTAAQAGPDGVTLTLRQGEQPLAPLVASHVLVAVGRRPNALDLPLARDGQGRVIVDSTFQTSIPGIHAVGDLTPGPMLAHKAMEEGALCVEYLAGHKTPAPLPAIPAVVYTHPELASVGRGEVGNDGLAIRCGTFPFLANGRARTSGEADGIVKVVAEQHTGRLLGVHILGPQAGELIGIAATALHADMSAAQWAETLLPHPALGEALREAALAAAGSPQIHA